MNHSSKTAEKLNSCIVWDQLRREIVPARAWESLESHQLMPISPQEKTVPKNIVLKKSYILEKNTQISDFPLISRLLQIMFGKTKVRSAH